MTERVIELPLAKSAERQKRKNKIISYGAGGVIFGLLISLIVK